VRAVQQPIDFDAAGYWWLAQLIHGVDVSNFDTSFVQVLFNLRQMAYPLFLAAFSFFFKDENALRISVSIGQLLMYWLGVIVFSRSLSSLVNRKRSELVGAVLLSLPFPYFLVTELLQDSLTMSVALLSFGLAIFSVNHRSIRFYLGSLLTMGYAMSIRTDSQYVALFVTICGSYVLFMTINRMNSSPKFFYKVLATVLSIVSTVLFVYLLRIPNYLVTRHLTGTGYFYPPINISFEKSSEVGLLYFKWTTGLDPLGGAVWSANPWMSAGDRELLRPLWHWYLENPLGGIATVFSKFFALVDWDWPFTYYSVLPSNPNLFLSILNYMIVGNGIIGALIVFKIAVDRRISFEKRFLGCGVIIAAIPYLVIHTLSHVEIRYGIAATVGLSIGATLLISSQKYRPVLLRLQILICVVWVPFSFLYSSWLRGFMHN